MPIGVGSEVIQITDQEFFHEHDKLSQNLTMGSNGNNVDNGAALAIQFCDQDLSEAREVC